MKKNILTEAKIRKNRTRGTVEMILERVTNMDLSSLLSNIFIHTDNPVAKELTRKYESQLILAVENPEEFKNNLHDFYSETARYIKKNQLFEEFFSFCYFVYSSLSAKQSDITVDVPEALYAYYDILFQQMNYFVSHPKLVYGLDKNGKPMARNEPFPYLDTVMMSLYEQMDKKMKPEDVYKRLNKLGYNIKNEQQFMFYQTSDHLLTNMILVMAYFINEDTIQINPNSLYLVSQGISSPDSAYPTDIYKQLLKEKRYFLPKKGVKSIYQNCGEIQEIFYQEVFTDNRIVLLYKVTATDGKEFSGFYDNKLELFFSPWKDTRQKMGEMIHLDMENFILENYCYLTTDISESLKELGIGKRLYLKNEVPLLSLKPLPSVEFLYEEESENEKSGKGTGQNFRLFDKQKYQESITHMNPQIRRLPEGWKASEEAMALAKEYHFVLREGETFVRPFERKSYKKKAK
ncbi:hypothetical protein PP175_26800 (plasmid) [Aneurinibacillus sp. Ricciae_BoGa-3]|uniref:hypothetical protein n=1 Tax=Aneurinibacillus sp. Ricciae_BoGa-3 TaxID=3022697 RepID=UPI00234002A8|nr:hypothetical protein [Aneurinibacillus sp. Ricciae_BoGa-3]WCK57647.1 hypothetical protein PP175_26800 [Aneurinibacillus sp. Ricciae_BoGa-3]